MTPIPSSYLARDLYDQAWLLPDEPAPVPAPRGPGFALALSRLLLALRPRAARPA